MAESQAVLRIRILYIVLRLRIRILYIVLQIWILHTHQPHADPDPAYASASMLHDPDPAYASASMLHDPDTSPDLGSKQSA